MLANPGLYIHFPWCVRKCPYCDFNSHPVRGNVPKADYISCLLVDWQQQIKAWTVTPKFDTVFLGGGTPSLFDADALTPLFQQLSLSAAAEITMEANPGTTEHADFSAYRTLGINRLSLGAQSFNSKHLQVLGRIHSADETQTAFQQARSGGFDNINIDLMYGLPEQTLEEALTDLRTAINLQPEHISWYQLTLEAKTEFAKRPPKLPDDETMTEIEAQGRIMLHHAGFERYEVSAYSRRHYQCRHNRNYWQFGDYLGIGAGAHGKITHAESIWRTRKDTQPRLYMAGAERMYDSTIQTDAVPGEFMLNALRLTDGVAFSTYEQNTRQNWSDLTPVWGPLAEQGLVREDRCATTPRGYEVLDSVVSQFL